MLIIIIIKINDQSSLKYQYLCFDLRLRNKFNESNQHTIYKMEKNFEKFAYVNLHIIKHY